MFCAEAECCRTTGFIPRATTKVPQSATRTRKANDRLSMFTFKLLMLLGILVALPGLEPGLFALRARTKNAASGGSCAEICR